MVRLVETKIFSVKMGKENFDGPRGYDDEEDGAICRSNDAAA